MAQKTYVGELIDACKDLIQYEGGTNSCGERLCPVCSEPMTGSEMQESHRDGCPMVRIRDAVDAMTQFPG